MNDIDIVIPWLNPTDKWFSQYKNYCENESPGRIRDLNTMQPALRSILKNLPWIRYIWLIVFDEEQHQNLDWEELKNKKVKFVYHSDIIPKEFIPNFNSMISEAYIHKIDGIADYFIFSNDDIIFNNYISKEYYLKNNKVVHRKKTLHEHKDVFWWTYSYIINSSSNFVKHITGKKFLSDDFHMPSIHKTDLLKFLWSKYEKYMYDSFTDSKIRKRKNLSLVDVMNTLEEMYNLCEYDECSSIKTSPIWLNDKTTKTDLINLKNNYDIICVNDGEVLSDSHSKIIANYIKEVFK